MTSIAIKSTNIVKGDQLVDGFVIIKNGLITDVLEQVPTGEFDLHDVGDYVVMPGIIDPHVHINEPGRTDWEGFETATKAALAGGITSLIEMPLNASPVTTTVDALDKKIAAAKGKLHTDCGFWGGIIPGNVNQVEPLIEKGVFGFKAFLTHSGIDEFPNVTEQDLRKAMPLIAKHDLPLLVHCELSITHAPAPVDDQSYSDYLASRPAKWEDDAITLMIKLCEEFNCRTHIVHLSSASAISLIAEAKRKGLPITAETAQHYLYFNAERIPNGRTEFKCAPPIREKQNNRQLWGALKNGIIDFVATDHSPAPPGLKETRSGNLTKAWGGISSIQFALPALWTAAKNQNCKLSDMVTWLASHPAKLTGLDREKGKIEKGYVADLVVWDPEEIFTLNSENIYHRHKLTPYLGETLSGVVKQTWLRGEKVFDQGNFKLNQGEVLLATK